MEVSPPAIEIIQTEEVFKDKAYDDARPDYVLQPGDKIIGTLTIGYGHTNSAREDDEQINIGDTVTEEEALEILTLDIAEFGKYVNNRANNFDVDLTQSQFDALVMASMNRDKKMSGGPLWRAIKSGDEEKIRELWNKTIAASVKAFPGLEDRKNEELDMFFGTYNTPNIVEEVVDKDDAPDRGIPEPEDGFVPGVKVGELTGEPVEDTSKQNMVWTKLFDDLSNAFIDNPRTRRERELFGRTSIRYNPPTDKDISEKIVYDSEEKQIISDNYTRLLKAISQGFMR
jgi:GH24 family phage-related lysozyme (muramidase)